MQTRALCEMCRMGNETSSITPKALNANGKSNGKVIAREVSPHLEVVDADTTATDKKTPKSFKALKKRRSKAVLKELNGIAPTEERYVQNQPARKLV